MKRLIGYVAAGASLRLFSHFQETVTYKKSVIIHAARLYGQTLGIEIAIAVTIILFAAMIRTARFRFLRISHIVSIGAGFFALPALWNNWSMSRFGGDGYITEITAGTGGPLAGQFFRAAACALIMAEIYFRCKPTLPVEGI